MGYVNHPLLEAIINASSAGDNVLIVGSFGNSIRVYALTVVFGGDTLLTIKSAGTALTGPMDMLTAGSIVLDPSGEPWYSCADGEGFIFNLSPGVQISGRVYYTQSATSTIVPPP